MYQSNLANGFHFLQTAWANNNKWVSRTLYVSP